VAALVLAIVLVFVAREIKSPDNGGPISNGTVPPSSVPQINTTLKNTQLSLTQVATVDAPTNMSVRPGEDNLYVTEQGGRIRRIRPTPTEPYQVDDQPVLDITDQVTSGGEQGLLGLAFSPDGKTLYVAYTNKDANQQLDAYAMPGDAVDTASRKTLLVIPDFAPNHNGGDLYVDASGLLYWTMGDGGGSGDPKRSGQNPKDLLGNILRIDPSKPSAGRPYSIPPDNPFADGTNGAPEVWMYGLRNPWRMSFDRDTNDLWIGDVGQNTIEEIDYVAAPVKGGLNFGWSDVEGTHPFHANKPPQGAVAPIYEYDHSNGRCSITGGYVYRGTRIPNLQGTYLFADYCAGAIQGLTRAPDGTITVTSLGMQLPGIASFGEDRNGELYALSNGGAIARIDGVEVPAPTSTTTPSAAQPAPSTSTSGNALGADPAPTDPASVADALVAAEHALRDPTTTPQAQRDDARTQQLAYRYLGAHPEWDAVALGRVPADLHDAVVANLDARRELTAIPGPAPRDEVPAWRVVAPAPVDDLLSAYHDAERDSGVAWNYLAAINLIESDLGRIQGPSTAGAQGPMQFEPATWDSYGNGGDINAPRDAIAGAARYLARNGFADGNVDGALFHYNHSDHYVRAVDDIASVLAADPHAFTGYYGWDVLYATTAGVVRLDVGYDQSAPISAADYVAANPDALVSGIATSH
jgi:glucose/arabinose dehydrogenase/membrane-bound lytic murein transglycosylase B